MIELRTMKYHCDNKDIPDEVELIISKEVDKETKVRIVYPGAKPIKFILKPK